MKKKVAELSGVELDYWAGMAANGTGLLPPWVLGRQISACVNGVKIGNEKRYLMPSQNWNQAGPIIEREKIGSDFNNVWGVWIAWIGNDEESPGYVEYQGTTPLEAAMRCFVASKFGEEVEV